MKTIRLSLAGIAFLLAAPAWAETITSTTYGVSVAYPDGLRAIRQEWKGDPFAGNASSAGPSKDVNANGINFAPKGDPFAGADLHMADMPPLSKDQVKTQGPHLANMTVSEVDLAGAKAFRIEGPITRNLFGRYYVWYRDGKRYLVMGTMPTEAKNSEHAVDKIASGLSFTK